jgi:hypothetical protein
MPRVQVEPLLNSATFRHLTRMRSTRLSLSPLAPRRHFTSITCSSRRPNALLSCPYGVSRNRINHGKRAFTSSAPRRRELEDYYKVLELPPQSTAGQIKTRYYEVCYALTSTSQEKCSYTQLDQPYAITVTSCRRNTIPTSTRAPTLLNIRTFRWRIVSSEGQKHGMFFYSLLLYA